MNSKTKLYRNFLILLSCVGITTGALKVINPSINNTHAYEEVEDSLLEDIKKIIYSSINLDYEEKKYLYNEEYFNDLVSYIRDYPELIELLKTRLTDVDIIGFEGYDIDNKLEGYYHSIYPNLLFVNNYKVLQFKRDTIAHELIHQTQLGDNTYNLLTESCAEIMSFEYYKGTSMTNYDTQVKLTKTLMEIIGSKPVKHYCITGDFSKIEEKVKPYLTEEEYNEFLNDLSFVIGDTLNNNNKFESLKKILSTLYFNYYNSNIEDDETINAIYGLYNGLKRFYFNERYINRENSYYLDRLNVSYKTIDLQTAIDIKEVTITSNKEIQIDTNTALNLISTSHYHIKRRENINKDDSNITFTSNYNGKRVISGTINGIEYINANVDELVSKGIINARYWIVDFRLLDAKDYINHNYDDDDLSISKNKDIVINDDFTVSGPIPEIIYLPTINERQNNLNLQLKK